MSWTWNALLAKWLPSQERRQLATLFPGVVASDVQAALNLLLDLSGQLAAGGTQLSADARLIIWQGVPLALPYRLYVREPLAGNLQELSNRQRQLVHCLYLRHHDGYVRQRHLEALFTLSDGAPEAFTTPFTFSLLGEYVQEILQVLEQCLTPMLLASYVQLIAENPLYWQQTRGRVASYWDVYYRIRKRGAPRFRHYVGARILARLDHACQVARLS
ncbi:hypothetical protein E4631_15800 [Hymenobacter sp. UV11]|uniref:hypothetical protein n=1 Tax=Hymenobacter sp. UV11 TaxID=1849735 RepID=UPI00105FCB51|nr:hypothetical protein [Hymenobacter sp. UV11]TDN39241.1 hypothetical protein A8B98_18440 [Hymenobacter sp. UV11]TFZ65680.1 hypothetical protein E4631_15800 [Hymenobacter sp. UV11]